MRLWAKNLMDEPPKPRSQMTTKDRALTMISIIVDSTIIGLLIYTLLANSCQICYQTGFGVHTFNQCKNVADVMETGLPEEVINIYEGKTPTQKVDSALGVEYEIRSSDNLTIIE